MLVAVVYVGNRCMACAPGHGGARRTAWGEDAVGFVVDV